MMSDTEVDQKEEKLETNEKEEKGDETVDNQNVTDPKNDETNLMELEQTETTRELEGMDKPESPGDSVSDAVLDEEIKDVTTDVNADEPASADTHADESASTDVVAGVTQGESLGERCQNVDDDVEKNNNQETIEEGLDKENEKNNEMNQTEVNEADETNERPQSIINVEIKNIEKAEIEEDQLEKPSEPPMVENNEANDDAGKDEMLQKENSFIKAVETEAKKVEQVLAPSKAPQNGVTGKKKHKKGIFICYSPDAGFLERKFVVELVRQLKENNLSEDIWFDKDEKIIDSPCWFSLRMEATERCRAAILIMSDSYLSSPISLYEGKCLLQRHTADANSVKIHMVLYSQLLETRLPNPYHQFLKHMVDLTITHARKSLAEKTSVVVGNLMESLEKVATALVPNQPVPTQAEFANEYKKKKIGTWSVVDLQDWLFNLGVKEFYRQNFAEGMIDGFLLMSMTDDDMLKYLGIDSRVVRKKIMQSVLLQLDKESKLTDNWHFKSRSQRAKPNVVYVIYDPADRRLVQNIKSDLNLRQIPIIHHQKLGQSKEEFLKLNGPIMATSQYVLVLMTEASATSPFVFHEVMFADWLGKKLVSLVFQNVWSRLRFSMRALLGDYPAIDFETKLYREALGILEYHVKPIRNNPGVVLEQSYLDRMADGLKPFEALASIGNDNNKATLANSTPKIFISYHWDMQSKITDIRHLLEVNGFHCWADITQTMSGSVNHLRGASSVSNRSNKMDVTETLQTQIQRNMKASSVVICCITPKYVQSDNCIKDLTLAETLHKPVLPIMLRFCPWPPEGSPHQVRKILVRLMAIDLSNEKLFKQNIPIMLEKVRKVCGIA